jgi:hypothetical protein
MASLSLLLFAILNAFTFPERLTGKLLSIKLIDITSDALFSTVLNCFHFVSGEGIRLSLLVLILITPYSRI